MRTFNPFLSLPRIRYPLFYLFFAGQRKETKEKPPFAKALLRYFLPFSSQNPASTILLRIVLPSFSCFTSTYLLYPGYRISDKRIESRDGFTSPRAFAKGCTGPWQPAISKPSSCLTTSPGILHPTLKVSDLTPVKLSLNCITPYSHYKPDLQGFCFELPIPVLSWFSPLSGPQKHTPELSIRFFLYPGFKTRGYLPL
ncbi:hypothetical protein [Membranihabitans maritimus]|uniref:hypothetical protein n=1 Tax=Membranihabitans maritimus TaxID=2904244 RepID=UPI001F3E11BF|nr:hypothetical protein [Membranihabitans maritimus]